MYNFRFEEEGGAEIGNVTQIEIVLAPTSANLLQYSVSYDRNVESVRRKDNKRKAQRERKKETALVSKGIIIGCQYLWVD